MTTRTLIARITQQPFPDGYEDGHSGQLSENEVRESGNTTDGEDEGNAKLQNPVLIL